MKRNMEKYIASGKKRALSSNIEFSMDEIIDLMNQCGNDTWKLIFYSMYIGIEAGYRMETRKQKA